jgi:tRNA threonylcarbamoyladenosine biosynthesis protein TsaB
MAKILCIDTATTICSVAIAENGELQDLIESKEKNAHGSVLTLLIQEILDKNHCSFGQLDAVAVSKGPGSYTGLRIGVSAAKGICYGSGLPLLGISTLQSMAALALVQDRVPERLAAGAWLCPLIDARRMEVYTAFYDQELTAQCEVEAKVIDEHSFSDILQERELIFFGNGMEKCKATLGQHRRAIFLDNIETSATGLTNLAEICYNHKQFDNMAYMEPFYLKDFVATVAKSRL